MVQEWKSNFGIIRCHSASPIFNKVFNVERLLFEITQEFRIDILKNENFIKDWDLLFAWKYTLIGKISYVCRMYAHNFNASIQTSRQNDKSLAKKCSVKALPVLPAHFVGPIFENTVTIYSCMVKNIIVEWIGEQSRLERYFCKIL